MDKPVSPEEISDVSLRAEAAGQIALASVLCATAAAMQSGHITALCHHVMPFTRRMVVKIQSEIDDLKGLTE